MSFYVSPSTGGGGGPSSWSEITGKPTFSTVALTGSFNDLDPKPAITQTSSGVSITDPIAGDGSAYLTHVFTENAPEGARSVWSTDYIFGRAMLAPGEPADGATGLCVGRTDNPDHGQVGVINEANDTVLLFTQGDQKVVVGMTETVITNRLEATGGLVANDASFGTVEAGSINTPSLTASGIVVGDASFGSLTGSVTARDVVCVDGSLYQSHVFTSAAPEGRRGVLETDFIYGRAVLAPDEPAELGTGVVIGETFIEDADLRQTGTVTSQNDQITLFTRGDRKLVVGVDDVDVYNLLHANAGLEVSGTISTSGFLAIGMDASEAESAVHIRGPRDVSGSAGIHMGEDDNGEYGIELVSGDGTGTHGFYVGASGDNHKGRIQYNLNSDTWEFGTREFSGVGSANNAGWVFNRLVRLSGQVSISSELTL